MEIEEQVNEIVGPYWKQQNWRKVQKILLPYVNKDDAHPLYYIYYAIALYYDFKYKDALQYSLKAYELEKSDPFILYHHGIILMVNKRFDEAIIIFDKVLSNPHDSLFKGKFSNGKRWGLSMVNDVIYYIAKTYFYKNDLNNAIKYYEIHLSKRKRGIPSFITKREVVKELDGTLFLRNYEIKYPEKAQPILHQ